MKLLEMILFIITVGTIFSAVLIVRYQDRQIEDLCLEYFKQVSKTKDSNTKINEMCFVKKFSMNEYSEALNSKN